MKIQVKVTGKVSRSRDLANPAIRFRPGSLEAELEEIASKIPKRDLRRLPKDLALNLDRYLYGSGQE